MDKKRSRAANPFALIKLDFERRHRISYLLPTSPQNGGKSVMVATVVAESGLALIFSHDFAGTGEHAVMRDAPLSGRGPRSLWASRPRARVQVGHARNESRHLRRHRQHRPRFDGQAGLLARQISSPMVVAEQLQSVPAESVLIPIGIRCVGCC